MTKHKILVVDDSEDTCKLIYEYLRQNNYDVEMAFDAAQAIDIVHKSPPNLILLDIGLPDIDGLTLIKILDKKNIDVILLSGEDKVEVKVKGLELGAQDYVTKPFHLTELLARVNTVIGRNQKTIERSTTQKTMLGNWQLDNHTRQLSNNADQIQFTSTEYKLLLFLVANVNHDVSRSHISHAVYNTEWHPNVRRIDTLVYQLRQKLKQFSNTPTIKSTHNQGYTLTAEAS